MTAHSADGGQPWLTLCVGVACISIDTNESASLIARSMDALRRARKSGGNRVWRHSDTRRTLIANSEGQLADELDSKFREGFGRGGDDGRDAPGKG